MVHFAPPLTDAKAVQLNIPYCERCTLFLLHVSLCPADQDSVIPESHNLQQLRGQLRVADYIPRTGLHSMLSAMPIAADVVGLLQPTCRSLLAACWAAWTRTVRSSRRLPRRPPEPFLAASTEATVTSRTSPRAARSGPSDPSDRLSDSVVNMLRLTAGMQATIAGFSSGLRA